MFQYHYFEIACNFSISEIKHQRHPWHKGTIDEWGATDASPSLKWKKTERSLPDAKWKGWRGTQGRVELLLQRSITISLSSFSTSGLCVDRNVWWSRNWRKMGRSEIRMAMCECVCPRVPQVALRVWKIDDVKVRFGEKQVWCNALKIESITHLGKNAWPHIKHVYQMSKEISFHVLVFFLLQNPKRIRSVFFFAKARKKVLLLPFSTFSASFYLKNREQSISPTEHSAGLDQAQPVRTSVLAHIGSWVRCYLSIHPIIKSYITTPLKLL